MKCREYIFELTSGRLEEGGWLLRSRGAAHRLTCVNCRAFTRNDSELLQAVRSQREKLIREFEPPQS